MTILANQTTTTVNVTGVQVGSNVTLTASLQGYTSGTTTVNVSGTPVPTVNVGPTAVMLSAVGTDTITVNRANSDNSVPLVVTLNVSRPGYVNVPGSVTIPATQTSVVVPISGIAPDPTPPVIISATAPGLQSGTNSQITVQIQTIQVTPALLVNPGASAGLVINLSAAAGANGVTVNLVSNLPAGGSGTGVATVPSSVVIPSGQTQVTAPVTGVSAGNAIITATATGFPAVQSQIQVQNVNLSFVPGFATFFAGPNYAQSVTVIMSIPAVSGGQTVNLTSSDTSVATVTSSVIIPSGSTVVNVTVTGVGSGVATITAGSAGLNSGTYTATVIAPTVRINNNESVVDTSTGVRTRQSVYISGTAPIGGVPVTITSSDPARLLVAPCDSASFQSGTCTDTNPPQSAVTISIPTGQNYAYFDVVGQDIAAAEVRFRDPYGVVRDLAGNVYIADYGSHVIRRIDGTTGIISTFAGQGSMRITETTAAHSAAIGGPTGLTIYGNSLYIAEYNQNAIRKIDLTSGVISTVLSGTVSNPNAVAFNAAGDMFISSFSNNRIYRLSPGQSGGTLSVYAGGVGNSATTVGVAGHKCSDGPSRRCRRRRSRQRLLFRLR